MRLAALAPLFAVIPLALSCPAPAAAQGEAAPRIVGVTPYDRAAPGQIMELRVEGLGERFTSPPENGDLRVLLTQDGSTQTAQARTAAHGFYSDESAAAPSGGAPTGMKAFQGVSFVVPRGLRAGEAEVVVAYRKLRSAPFKLNIIERPLRPVIGGTSIVTMSPASLPPPQKGGPASPLGLRFERGARRVGLHVRPLSDPEDPDSAVLVRFRQGGAVHDAAARVVHHERKTETVGRGMRFMPARDALEVDVPEALAAGAAELEVRLRAAGQTGEPAIVPVTITDAERAYEAPAAAAPRALSVTPRRVGAGQPLMISVDRRRALDPDPSKVVVVFETPDGSWGHKVRPELNSAVRNPSTPPDAPVLLIARAPKEMTGAVQVRLLNPAREEHAGASSEPAQVEVVAEALAPQLQEAAESSGAELARLRQISDAQQRAGLPAPPFDPARRYVTIRADGLDYNPRFLRVRMEQDGRGAFTLGPGDFFLYTNSSFVVRVPKEIGPGPVRLSVENRGANGYSPPAVRTFELTK